MKTPIKLALSAALLFSSSLYADDKADIEMLKKQVKELQEMTQTLTDETSDLKTGFNYTTVDTEKSFTGLGAAASKVYYSKSPLSIGGYGEMYYSTKQKEGSSSESKVDVYRFVPYFGYKFTDNIILNTEIEFEHGGAKEGSGGYAIIEFMYLDFLFNEYVNARVGNFLVPMGLINERHEPTLFATVQRPDTEKYIIPSTWHESGAMIFGNITDDISYRLAMITALKTEENGYKWLRNGRAGSTTSQNPEFAGVARVDYTGINGLLVGASAYYGDSDAASGNSSNTFMYDFHLDYKVAGFRAYGIYSQVMRSNADTISAKAAKEAKGGYLNLSYDVLATMKTNYSLPVFVQYESVDAQGSLVDGSSTYIKSGDTYTVNKVNTTTVGINFFPHEQVVLKADYAMADNQYVSEGEGKSSDTFSLSFGFIF